MKTIFLLGLSLAFVACVQTGENWVGFFYPSGSVVDGVEIEEFLSEEACISWADELTLEVESEEAHFYCGYDCRYDNKGQYTCSD
jgi:hypothetical protein